MKIAITGHRPNKLGSDYDLTSPLIQKIKDKIVDYPDRNPEALSGREIELIYTKIKL